MLIRSSIRFRSLPISELRRRKQIVGNIKKFYRMLIITYLRVKETKTKTKFNHFVIIVFRSLPISELRRRKQKQKMVS